MTALLSNGGPLMVEPHPDDRMTYVQMHIRDFLSGVANLRPDQIGIYQIILMMLYDKMGQLPDNDHLIASHCQCEVRYYRRLKTSLVEAGKIFVADGYIYNNRVLSEIAKFCETARKKRDAARAREAARRDALQQQSSPKMQTENDVQLPERRATGTHQTPGARLTGNENHKKDNEINDSDITAVPHHPPRLSIYKEKKEVRESSGRESYPIDRVSPELPLSETDVSDGIQVADERSPKKPYTAEFDAFWKSYPENRGMSKIKAWKRWAKMPAIERARAVEAVPLMKAYLADMRKRSPDLTCLHAEGYLNQRRYETLLESAASSGDPTVEPWWQNIDTVRKVSDDKWRSGIAEHANGRWPVKILGPPPGDPKCVVPQRLVAELKLTEIYTEAGIKRR